MFKLVWCTYLLLVLVSDAEPKQFLAIAGPFKVLVRKVESCIDQITSKNKWTYYVHDSRKKNGAEVTFTGNHSVPFDLDNSSGGRIKLASSNGLGGWRENAHVLGCREVCRCLEFVASHQWENYQMRIFGEKAPCPHPAGIYRFDNITVDLTNFAIKQFVYGRWRADVQLMLKTGEVGGCIRVYADTVPI